MSESVPEAKESNPAPGGQPDARSESRPEVRPEILTEEQFTKSPWRVHLPKLIAGFAAVIALLTAREFFRDGDGGANSDRAFSGPIVGEIQSIEGQVLVRPPRGTRFEAAKPGAYRAESVLQTQAASAAVIMFQPGPTLRLLENSRLVAEVDTSRDGAIQATILAGEVTVLDAGTNPLFTLLYNGAPVPFRDGETPMPRTVPLISIGPGIDDPNAAGTSGGTSTDLEEKLEVEKESEMATAPSVDLESANPQPAPTPAENRPKSLPAKSARAESLFLRSTLTNDDIRSQVRSQGGSFQKCYVTMVNRMSESKTSAQTALPKGETLVSFKILPTGKVEDQRVLRSPFKDATFDRCIAEAIGRLRFRQFQGAAIPVGEFPIVLE